jgi:hypothetical protein
VTRSTPPKDDEFEISIIGPGRGECILLHLGDNYWCIVDSCTARGSAESAAVEYLDSFGNGAPARVRLVVATHWHDDHIRGLASILRRAPAAAFYCSAALKTEVFRKLVMVATGDPGRSGIDEFASILGVIGEKPGAGRLATPKWAIENRKLLDPSNAGHRIPATITALSPSDTTIALAHLEIAKLLPKTGEQQRRIPNVSTNHTSVVLWVEVGAVRALLGADLEHSDHPDEGWTAVLACHGDPTKAFFFKVPHHGSSNADCPEVWTRMLDNNPIAVVTPFNGGVRIPMESDLRRLAKRTDRLYCTAAGTGKAPSRDAVVEKTMRRELKERRVVEGPPGHVRVRWSRDDDSPSSVELFNRAYPVPGESAAN